MSKKRHIVLICFSLLILSGACKMKLTRFHLDYNAVTDQPFENGQVISFRTPEVKTDCRVRFERNNTKRSKVKRIYLSKLRFSSDSLQSISFPYKKLKKIYISSPSYSEKEISLKNSKITRSATQFVIQLKDSDPDIIDFIKQDRFSMRFDFEKTSDSQDKKSMYVNIELFVEGELIKTNLYHKILV